MENDCPLSKGGGNFDSGSFLDLLGLGVSQSGLMTYVQQLSQWVAYFGEVSDSCSPPITDCPSALSYFALYHGAAFKMLDAAGYQSAWTAGGCWNQIQNQLGYWIQLDSVTHQSTASAGQSITVKTLLRNLGWSRMFSPRHLVASACMTASPYTCYSGTSSADMRRLPPQANSSLDMDATVSIPVGAAAGTYEIRLSLPDIWPNTQSRAFMVRFANGNSGAQTWNDSLGHMTTGTILQVN
jgi:hypothetical protein